MNVNNASEDKLVSEHASGAWALITGATTGIGYEFARIAANQKYNLALVARNRERLEEAASSLCREFAIHCETYSQNLSEHGGSENVIRFLRRKKLHIDLLINNAGAGMLGRFADLDITDQLDLIRLNQVSLTHLTHYVLTPMLARGSGAILNIASTAAFQPGPLMAIYYATKAFVLSFTQAIAEETRGSGVLISVLCPGPTRTGFQKKAGVSTTSFIYRMSFMDAPTVARRGWRGLHRGHAVIVPGFSNKALALASRLLPRWFTARIVHELQKSRER